MGGKIDAETSLKLNLVDKVFEAIEFESKCIAYMNELNRINFNLVRSIKRLMYNKEEVENYFDKESPLLLL